MRPWWRVGLQPLLSWDIHTLICVFWGKNITADNARFLEEPDEYKEEDTAVPYTPLSPPAPPAYVGTDDDESNEEADIVAHSSEE